MAENKNVMINEYSESTHRIGRIWTIAALVLIASVPLLFGIINGITPDWTAMIKGFIAVVPMYWAIGIIEVFNYSPMLGSGGTYLAFVTGNLANMKVPAAQVALKKADVSAASEEGEVLATIAVAVSTIVTDLILIIGLVFVIPITSWIESNAVLSSVFDLSNGYVIPALFGALGVVFVSKSWKVAALPTLLMILVFLLVPSTYGVAPVLIPVISILAVFLARYMYKKNMI